MGEAEAHLAAPRPSPLDRDQENLAETLEDLADRPRGWDLRRLGRDDRDAETLEDLAEDDRDH